MAHNDVPYPSLDTPSLLVDMDRLEANIREMSSLAAEAGLKLRPHTKIRECADIAKMQIDAGAFGVSTANLAEAESMAEAWIDDAIVVHPFYGHRKMEAVKALLERPGFRISVVVDMIEQAEATSEVGAAVGQVVPILLKIDTASGDSTVSQVCHIGSGQEAPAASGDRACGHRRPRVGNGRENYRNSRAHGLRGRIGYP